MGLKEKIKKLPDSPGVYIMKSKDRKAIYVGKANSLRKRISSHFKNYSSSKQDLLIPKVKDVDYIPTVSEAEALLLEADLIKRLKPRYNVNLRDDKSFPLIKITNDKFPAIFICRPKKKDKAKYFGPYTNAKAIRELIKEIRKIFPFRSCRKLPKKACLHFHIGLCAGPCVGKISEKDYSKIINNICLILKGKREPLLGRLSEQMHVYAEKGKFEEAAQIRDQIIALNSIYSGTHVENFFQEARQLADILKLKKLPFRIEAFDVSNIFGKEAVGSMVSFWQGSPDKNNYRRFRIKESQGQINDYKMLSEITRRRYQRLKSERLGFPDLILVDGGKGQVSVVKKELDRLNLDLPLIGIAKTEEKIIALNKINPIILPKNSPALRLIMRIRDEAHRFALAYHHILRRKMTFEQK
ncbi:MAG: excinuclease ABC subunit UvrC [Candidatus Omnitrophota bacterium]